MISSRKTLAAIWEEKINAMLRPMKKERRNIPRGSLTVNRQPRGIVYYEKGKGRKARGITRNKARVYQLARRAYLDRKVKELQRIADALHDIRDMRQSAADYIGGLEDTGLDPGKIAWSQKQREGTTAGGRNPAYPEELIYETNGGVLVRTKSEQALGNLYEELGIPYAYECRLPLEVTEMKDLEGVRISNGRAFKSYYPDFTIFLADGTTMIHEHLGRIDLEPYRYKTSERIVAMTLNGLPTDRLLLTYEKDMADLKGFRRVLEERVLPFV